MSDEERRFGGSPKVKVGKKGKKDKDRHSSEEESLVDKASKPKKKVFKLPTGPHKKASESKIKKKSVKGIRPKDDLDKRVGPEPVFGVPLEEAVRLSPSSDGVPVPLFLRRAMDFVDEHLGTEGIYRVSPPLSGLKELRKRIEEKPTEEIVFSDAHHASGIVKLFMREMPDSILSDELQTHLLDVINKPKSYLATSVSTNMNLEQLVCHELRTRLTIERFVTLAYLLLHVHRVLDQSASNKMSFQNMGLMLWQTLRINEQALLSYLLKHAKDVFSEVRPRRFDPHARDEVVDFPGSKFALQEELSKQEALLAALHEEAYHNAAAETLTEEQQQKMQQKLWDVQAVVTQLRRKLKSLNADSKTSQTTQGQNANNGAAGSPSFLTEEMFVEKQLWAVHMNLRQQIAQEQARIDALKRELADLVASEEEPLSSDEWSGAEDQESRESSRTPPTVVEASAAQGNPAAATNGDVTAGSSVQENGDAESELVDLQARHAELVGQIIEERNATADVQAKLEMLSMDDELTDGDDVVVTRF